MFALHRWPKPGTPRCLEAVKLLRPLKTYEHTFHARQDEKCQRRRQCHHRKRDNYRFRLRDRVNHCKHWKDDRNHDHQGKIRRPVIDARVAKVLPTTVALVFHLDVLVQYPSLSAARALEPEAPENRVPRIALIVCFHGPTQLNPACFGLAEAAATHKRKGIKVPTERGSKASIHLPPQHPIVRSKEYTVGVADDRHSNRCNL